MKKLVLMLILLAACQPAATATPVPPTQVLIINTPVPTANALPSRTPTLPPTLTLTPSDTPTFTLTPSLTPSPTLTLFPTNTFIPTEPPTATDIPSATPGQPAGTAPPTWTPPPPDPAAQIADHYMFARPISNAFVNWVARTYPYGGTAGGTLQVHHGVDLVNPTGTPILAAADGTVVYAGNDLTTLFGPQNNYYGNLVVIQHNFLSPQGQPVFTLYGHMSQVLVNSGAVVKEGQTIGLVGATGIALGPHLHFEVRIGDPFSFAATRNPELWIRPYQRYGTLAGRVTDANGNLLYQVTLTVKSSDITRYVYSYADNTVNGDTAFGENYVLGDLPADYYTVIVGDNGQVRFQKLIYVYPNRTTWLDVQLSP